MLTGQIAPTLSLVMVTDGVNQDHGDEYLEAAAGQPAFAANETAT